MINVEDGIILVHPSRYLGGTEILFKRIIDLVLNKVKNVYLVDYTDGALKKITDSNNVIFIDFLQYSNWGPLLESNKLIVSSRNIARVISLANNGNVHSIDMLAWVVHPSELYTGFIPGTTWVRKLIGYSGLKVYLKIFPFINEYKKVIRFFINNGSICFMDEACLREVEWALFENFPNAQLLPLITSLETRDISKPIISNTGEFCVMSRIEGFKTEGILKLINDLSMLAIKNKKHYYLHLIGDGDDIDKVKRNVMRAKNVTVNFHGFIANDSLDGFFENNNVQVLFAMGTSALEGLSRGVATILLPCSDVKIKNRDKVYKVMHLQGNNSLGEYINTPFESDGYVTLAEALMILDDVTYDSNVVRKYFYRNYSKNKTESEFLKKTSLITRVGISHLLCGKLIVKYLSILNKKRVSKGF